MAIEDRRSNLRLEEPADASRPYLLHPRAYPISTGRRPDIEFVSILVGTDFEAQDALRDWETASPEGYEQLRLTVAQRRSLQGGRLFLRNRRIVAGYEELDRYLRGCIGGADADSVITWLTVGKWTAKAIGDLLLGEIAVPRHERRIRQVVRLLIQALPRRTLPMGRALVLGNREIFAQVAGVLVNWFELPDSDRAAISYPDFAEKYGEALLGRGAPGVSDELLWSVRPTTRDPLSDSLLRSMHAYYRAAGARKPDRDRWVLIGNLYLAAYEQRVAQTFVEIAISATPRRMLDALLRDAQRVRSDEPASGISAPRDYVPESGLLGRLVDLVAAAFATRFVLALPVGAKNAKVFAPAQPLTSSLPRLLEDVGVSSAIPARRQLRADLRAAESPPAPETAEPGVSAQVEPEKPGEDVGESLERLWLAIDRAEGVPDRTVVHDWRNYQARLSYIANLFVVSEGEAEFRQPVFPPEEEREYLEGLISSGIELTSSQAEVARRILQERQSQVESLSRGA